MKIRLTTPRFHGVLCCMQSRDTEIKMIIGRIKCYPVTALWARGRWENHPCVHGRQMEGTGSYFDQEHPGEPMASRTRSRYAFMAYRIFIEVQKRSPTLPGRIACALRYPSCRDFFLCVLTKLEPNHRSMTYLARLGSQDSFYERP